jgi:hypothetical protein
MIENGLRASGDSGHNDLVSGVLRSLTNSPQFAGIWWVQVRDNAVSDDG